MKNKTKPTRGEWIGGWQETKPESNKAEQIVNGKWYSPILGCDSLQEALTHQSQQLLKEIVEKIERNKSKKWKRQKRAAYKTRSEAGMGFTLGYKGCADEIIQLIQGMGKEI